jgi:hypothetical protein
MTQIADGVERSLRMMWAALVRRPAGRFVRGCGREAEKPPHRQLPRSHAIYVTQPAMPPLADFVASLEQIWDSKFLTNGGQFHQRSNRRCASTSASSTSRCSPTARWR